MITLSGSNYPCLKQISMVPKMFKPLRFDCIVFYDSAIFQQQIQQQQQGARSNSDEKLSQTMSLSVKRIDNCIQVMVYILAYRMCLRIIIPNMAGLGGSVGYMSNWLSGDYMFDPRQVRQILLWKLIMKYFLQSFFPVR